LKSLLLEQNVGYHHHSYLPSEHRYRVSFIGPCHLSLFICNYHLISGFQIWQSNKNYFPQHFCDEFFALSLLQLKLKLKLLVDPPNDDDKMGEDVLVSVVIDGGLPDDRWTDGFLSPTINNTTSYQMDGTIVPLQ
jgi:hypothetical protein